MLHRIVPGLIAILVLVSPASTGIAGAARQDRPDVAKGAATADPLERLVGLPGGSDVAALAAQVGAQWIDSLGGLLPAAGPPLGVEEVALLRWAQPQAAKSGEHQLLNASVALFVEPNYTVRTPEVGGCGALPGGAGTQQCTVAFVDVTPTQGEFLGQSAVSAIGLRSMPPTLAGKETWVAVIDTGVDPTHPWLQGRLLGPGYDFLTNSVGGIDVPNGLDDDQDGWVDEAYGHGTHVSGLIALVDPSAKLIPYRVLDADGNGSAFDVARAIRRAAADGAHCINLSLGLSKESLAVRAAIESVHGGEDGGGDEGTVIVASAGNQGTLGIGSIARHEGTLAVAAVDSTGALAEFSNFGPEVDLVAPGVAVYSALPGGRFAWWSGTSMATAIASGCVSRIRSSFDEAKAKAAQDAILDAAASVQSQNPGLDDWLGDGLIDLEQAYSKLGS